MMASRRPFRIEVTTAGRSAAPAVNDVPPGIQPAAAEDAHFNRVLQELVEIRSEIAKFNQRDPEADRERDRNVLWAGIETIQDAIRNTKTEIASLHSEGTRGEKLFRATDELDAVVYDTEEATEAILSCAEAIDTSVNALLGRLSGDDLSIAEEIQANVIKTFEACNFQDITGQRIRKVVKLLVFIEQRVQRMTDIWGGADAVAQDAGIIPREGDEALLNGPALADDENVVSQDDIDSLFA
ncbi:protein phosphatase CheZ [Aquabacter sp. P-9]|uniref:protein phosphatase CheZ n=1 Tax=Aquabacter sediminis TaxID=3029197 RepID=UPI00237DD8A3|nr:protein phosphatase CheZ [Aquabacter sp. P-9]MDE1570925.1 protein phosphatase CheZ [Aquabacter sp. P-9]